MGLIRKAVFLDRDGTINRDSSAYIKSREEFEFLPGSLDAIKNLTYNGFVNFVITNQTAGKSRMYFTAPTCPQISVTAANLNRA